MDTFQQHEVFEIEVLDALHRSKVLEPLVFGGGTMLRLCHELPRYSVDLDFWLIRVVEEEAYQRKLQQALEIDYEITDAQIKYYTMVIEIRSHRYPRRLKIEIRRVIAEWDFQEKIAFSQYSTRQVVLKAHTLEQTMRNKIAAFLDRTEIRDCFDIEFLLRRGMEFPPLDSDSLARFQKKLQGFKERDFKVKLGSVLESDIRSYYIAEGFSYLQEKLNLVSEDSRGR
jgi:predicted nucleotidyltransferase component of viral defense system